MLSRNALKKISQELREIILMVHLSVKEIALKDHYYIVIKFQQKNFFEVFRTLDILAFSRTIAVTEVRLIVAAHYFGQRAANSEITIPEVNH